MQVRGPLVGQEQVTPGQQLTGHVTSRSRGEGGGQSWRDVGRKAAASGLNKFAKSQGITYLLELEV